MKNKIKVRCMEKVHGELYHEFTFNTFAVPRVGEAIRNGKKLYKVSAVVHDVKSDYVLLIIRQIYNLPLE